jgi:hypothetical protein
LSIPLSHKIGSEMKERCSAFYHAFPQLQTAIN